MAPGGPHALRATAPHEGFVTALGARLPRVGLDGVLAAADRQATPCAVPGEAVVEGFTWDEQDRHDATWWPQGVASTPDGRVQLVSWYAKRRWLLHTQGSRLTVVDRTDPRSPRYAHVLLVAPRRPHLARSLRAVPVHAGGIAVLGDRLLVADTRAGVRVFRLGDVLRVPRRGLDALLPWRGAGTRTLGRRLTGGYTAYGYDFVLPQLMRLRLRGPLPDRTALRFSFLSVAQVDGVRTLVAGEYGRKGSTPRLACYPLDERTGLPVAGPDGWCRPSAVHERQPLRMQGVAVDDGTWFVSASAGEGNPGDLHVGRPGAFTRHRGVLPTGPEDLDLSGGRLWSVTEWPGRRFVFSVDPARWRPSGG